MDTCCHRHRFWHPAVMLTVSQCSCPLCRIKFTSFNIKCTHLTNIEQLKSTNVEWVPGPSTGQRYDCHSAMLLDVVGYSQQLVCVSFVPHWCSCRLWFTCCFPLLHSQMWGRLVCCSNLLVVSFCCAVKSMHSEFFLDWCCFMTSCLAAIFSVVVCMHGYMNNSHINYVQGILRLVKCKETTDLSHGRTIRYSLKLSGGTTWSTVNSQLSFLTSIV